MLNNLGGLKQSELAMVGNQIYNMLVNDYGIAHKQALEFIKDYPEQHIREKMIYTAQQRAKGKADNIPGFLSQAIKEDYRDPSTITIKNIDKASVLPRIQPGMKIDTGAGSIQTVMEGNCFYNSQKHVTATENDIRLNIAAGKYKIVEGGNDNEMAATAGNELDKRKFILEDVPSDNVNEEDDDIVEEIEYSQRPTLDDPIIKEGMKIDLGGVVFSVSKEKNLINNFGYVIFKEKQLRKHLRAGACVIVKS